MEQTEDQVVKRVALAALLLVPVGTTAAVAVTGDDSAPPERKITLALPGPFIESAATSTVPATTTTVFKISAGATVDEAAVRVDPPDPPPLSVEEMIRAVWPDDLEERALRIAYRESRFQPGVRTWCCFGVFQIHKVHLSWLGEYGVFTVEQLYDPMTNVEAAYQLYVRDGWGPWTCCT